MKVFHFTKTKIFKIDNSHFALILDFITTLIKVLVKKYNVINSKISLD